jgi:uncharacterized protein (UPF0276 family)
MAMIPELSRRFCSSTPPIRAERALISLGFALQPHEPTLELCEPLLGEVDYFEVAPETLWRSDERGELVPNGFHRRFEALRAASGRPFVAHGVGLSVGTASELDRARQLRWLAAIAATQRAFGFRWYTDHSGASTLDGAR